MDPAGASYHSDAQTFSSHQYLVSPGNPNIQYYSQSMQQPPTFYNQDPVFIDYSQGGAFYVCPAEQGYSVSPHWPEGAVQQVVMPQQLSQAEQQYRQPPRRGGQNRRGRGGRGGGSGRSRQEFQEFRRCFQQGQVNADIPVESLKPQTEDYKVAEERTYLDVTTRDDDSRTLGVGAMNEQQRHGGARSKQRGQYRGNFQGRNYDNKAGSYRGHKQYPSESGQQNPYNNNMGRRNNTGGRADQWGRQGAGPGHDLDFRVRGQWAEYGSQQGQRNKQRGPDPERLTGQVSSERSWQGKAKGPESETSQGDQAQNKSTKQLKFRELHREENNSAKDRNRNQKALPRFKGKMQSRVNLQDGDQETQRGALIEQLSTNSYECMVCCEIVRCDAAVWSCANCFHVFHLRCVKRWARSPAAVVEGESGGWRCPACQNVSQQFPHNYTCFCGKEKDPEWNRLEIPHSCGDVCGKKRGANCPHSCNILCHPGPCPPCHASVVKACDCGKTKQTVKCGQAAPKCDKGCEKTLNCGKHECKAVCHEGSCEPCEVQVHQVCYCSKEAREVICGTAESFSTLFSCQQICDRLLACGNHQCEQICHAGTCNSCQQLPSAVTHCPCGKRPLDELDGGVQRESCTDPVPTCDNTCGKTLRCGPKDKPHTCKMKCHGGECAPCEDGVTPVPCRCGILEQDIACSEAVAFTPDKPMLCDKRCNKKRMCNRHKCPNLCCVDQVHPCDLICGGKLSCGLHRCEEPCHRGNCPTCWHVSFDELHCHCGAEVIYPPVPCGTQPPPCVKTCRRSHTCDHTVRHNCHSEDQCPPCTELTEKWCMGHHERRRNIACHLADISCGLPCNKELPCGKHKCKLICHKGDCMKEGEVCKQSCPVPREECGHPCGLLCHGTASCKKTPCQTQIVIKCKCGNRAEKSQCLLGVRAETQDYQKVALMMMATKMGDVQSGETFDISTLTSSDATKKKLRQLECNKECDRLERNKRVALALEIKNPDIQGKLGAPTYSLFLKDFARQNLAFVTNVEKQLSDLVFSAQKSKQPKRSHAFPPMNSAQRRLIHELAPQYGCDTMSYDQEPKKNVVATAFKDRCWQPNIGLSTIIQRELNLKAPVPIPHHSSDQDVRPALGGSTVVGTGKGIKVLSPWGRSTITAKPSAPAAAAPPAQPGSWASHVKRNTPAAGQTDAKPKPPEIDYFDMTD